MPDAHDLDVALRHLLQGVPHVIVYAETRHGPLRSAVEIIFLRVAGEAPGLPVSAALANATESVAEEGWGLDDLADRALSGPTGVDRAASLERLSHRVPATEAGEAKVSEVIRAALRDLDDGVREQAIDILKSRSDEVPLPLLAEMARDDVSPARRVQALELIAERAPEQAVESLRAALGDPEPEVGVRALELLADLHLPVAESARP